MATARKGKIMRRKRIQAQNVHALGKLGDIPREIGQFNSFSVFDQGSRFKESSIQEGLSKRLRQFITAYERATEFIKNKSRLAYRLDLITEDLPVDDVYASKIGGIPDLCGTESKIRYLDKEAHRKDRSVIFNFPTVDEFVADHWPRCPICLRPMRFLAQINIWDWLIVIHQLTAQTSGKRKRNNWEQSYSAMGSGYQLMKYGVSHLADQHLMIWHCASSCSYGIHSRVHCQWSHNGKSAVKQNKRMAKVEKQLGVTVEPAPKAKQTVDMFGAVNPWTVSEYRQAVRRFIKGESELQTSVKKSGVMERQFSRVIRHRSDDDNNLPILIEPKKIVDAQIGFDLLDLDYDDAPNDPLFNTKSDYVLFGEARSQQEPRSPFCPSNYYGIHRMAPIICYDEPDHDLTHQIYACLSCGSGPYGEFDNPFPGILDSSCT